MNIYLISQDECTGYDIYASAVVIAKDEESARSTHPSRNRSDWDGKASVGGAWPDKSKVKVKFLGRSDTQKAGVILSSFIAG